jgi:dTDP-4-dehydrorhamnose 3,5-epimerase-like enzyme
VTDLRERGEKACFTRLKHYSSFAEKVKEAKRKLLEFLIQEIQRSIAWNALPDRSRQEAKFLRCMMVVNYQVIIDLCRDSPTFKQHVNVVLSAEDRQRFYVPKGFAHGFLTLAEKSGVFYQTSQFYSPEHTKGANGAIRHLVLSGRLRFA